jgi:small-conductance mechanosensitive channel
MKKEIKDVLMRFDWHQILLTVLVIVGAIVLTRTVKWLINKSFEKADEIDATRFKFFKNASSLIIWTVALAIIIYSIPKFRSVAITLFAGAGIFMAILGFAAQQAFANIISGIFIVISKPFRVGDMVKVGSQDYGIVEDVTLRHTVINSFENKRIIVPNSIMGSEILVNDSINEKEICRFIEVGISYDSDVDQSIQIIQEEALKHPQCIDKRTAIDKANKEPQVNVRLISFGEYSVNLRAYVWIDNPLQYMQVHSDINRAIKKRFDAEGIEIPFPYRTIVYKKDMQSEYKSSTK